MRFYLTKKSLQFNDLELELRDELLALSKLLDQRGPVDSDNHTMLGLKGRVSAVAKQISESKPSSIGPFVIRRLVPYHLTEIGQSLQDLEKARGELTQAESTRLDSILKLDGEIRARVLKSDLWRLRVGAVFLLFLTVNALLSQGFDMGILWAVIWLPIVSIIFFIREWKGRSRLELFFGAFLINTAVWMSLKALERGVVGAVIVGLFSSFAIGFYGWQIYTITAVEQARNE